MEGENKYSMKNEFKCLEKISEKKLIDNVSLVYRGIADQ
jgi:hypothetical protein